MMLILLMLMLDRWSASNPYMLATYGFFDPIPMSNERESRWWVEDSRRLNALKAAAMGSGLFFPGLETASFDEPWTVEGMNKREHVEGFINVIRMRRQGIIALPVP